VTRDGFILFTMVGDDKTGRERKERLRARRDEAGLAQVSGWVSKERRAYARQVLAALSQGSNSLPPDPEQAAALKTAQTALEAAQTALEAAQTALEAAQAEAAAARIAEAAACEGLLAAQQHGQTLATELEAARTEIESIRGAGHQAEVAALAQVEAAKATAALALATAERFQKASGLRGKAIRWLAR